MSPDITLQDDDYFIYLLSSVSKYQRDLEEEEKKISQTQQEVGEALAQPVLWL